MMVVVAVATVAVVAVSAHVAVDDDGVGRWAGVDGQHGDAAGVDVGRVRQAQVQIDAGAAGRREPDDPRRDEVVGHEDDRITRLPARLP